MSCMTWSSMTWTQVNMIVKTWQPPQIWKSCIFSQDLAVPQVLKCYIFCSPMSPSLDNDCSIQDLAFQVLKLFRGKAFQHYRPLPWIMSFMAWSSKTWTHLELFFKTWQPQFWNLACFQDLESQVLKCFSAIPCPQVLTMIALFKTWLSNSWNLLGQIISTV